MACTTKKGALEVVDGNGNLKLKPNLKLKYDM